MLTKPGSSMAAPAVTGMSLGRQAPPRARGQRSPDGKGERFQRRARWRKTLLPEYVEAAQLGSDALRARDSARHSERLHRTGLMELRGDEGGAGHDYEHPRR